MSTNANMLYIVEMAACIVQTSYSTFATTRETVRQD